VWSAGDASARFGAQTVNFGVNIMDVKRAGCRFFLFALLGLLIEVFFTATAGLINDQNYNLRGSTSPWMMLDYGILGIATLPISTWLISRRVPLVGRAVVYMVGIFVIEYFSGLLFTAAGLRIWNYDHLAYNLHGQITLLYAPFWFALGLGIETLHRRVDAMAVTLLRGLDGDELMKL